VPDKQQLIDSILGLQERINCLNMACGIESWMKLDMTIDQLKSLIIIQYKGKASYKELAQALGITRANITGIADPLIQNHLVIKRQNPGDRRIQYLMLTEKAQEILNNIKQTVITEETKILSSLNIEDLAVLEKGFSAFTRSAETYMLSRQNNKIQKMSKQTAQKKLAAINKKNM
jgi:DNA-binding MarR family transcriptional regulator